MAASFRAFRTLSKQRIRLSRWQSVFFNMFKSLKPLKPEPVQKFKGLKLMRPGRMMKNSQAKKKLHQY